MQRAYWEMLLGGAYAMRSLKWLLPITASLMMGASYGTRIARSVIPFSRIPGLLNAVAAVFSLTFVFTIAVMVQNVCGGYATLTGILCTLTFIFASLRPGELKQVDDQKPRAYCWYVKYASLVSAVVFFIIAMMTDDLILAWYRLLAAKGLIPDFSDLRKLMPEDWWGLARLSLTLVGTSRISAVFFADSAIALMHDFHEGEAQEDTKAQAKSQKAKLLKDIATVFSADGRLNIVDEERRSFPYCGSSCARKVPNTRSSEPKGNSRRSDPKGGRTIRAK